MTALRNSVFICHPPHPNCHGHYHQGKAFLPLTCLVFRMPYVLPFQCAIPHTSDGCNQISDL